jgi:hypothetical protein
MRRLALGALLAFSACGGAPTSALTDGASEIRDIQLNDTWAQVFPSEAITLDNDYRFQAPKEVQVVGGTFAGSPMQYIRARIRVGPTTSCEYLSTSTDAKALPLIECYGMSKEVVTLPSGTVIELNNYDAPGLLLEVHFQIAR